MHILVIVVLLAIVALILLSQKKKVPPIETVGSKYEKEITANSFEEMVVETSNTTPVLVDFYANWCQPCRYLTPLLSEMASEYQGTFLLAKVDAEKNQTLKMKYSIDAFPTVILFKEGEVIERFTGVKLEHSVRFTLAKHGIHANEQRT